eukprot:TRINITY_DN23503_c0_g1_i1.p2 TRINITY_DN23503_c0_g1~~TRINITY_DN23503_c0_g1_i1.p2  ORF type:complete len:124 (-),score=9.78 TRINITY_DN23503_c0_g1_i1:152-523(-)
MSIAMAPQSDAGGGSSCGIALDLRKLEAMDALRDACPAATVGVGNGTITPPPSHGPTRKALKVGKYILLKTLGKGSSSEVKLAQHSETGEHVAVKVMRCVGRAHIFQRIAHRTSKLREACFAS